MTRAWSAATSSGAEKTRAIVGGRRSDDQFTELRNRPMKRPASSAKGSVMCTTSQGIFSPATMKSSRLIRLQCTRNQSNLLPRPNPR